MAVALDGRESYLNEPNDYPSADSRMETRPLRLERGMKSGFPASRNPRTLFVYNVNIDKPGVYRVDAFFANGTYDVSDGNTCALRSLYLNGRRRHAGFPPIRPVPETGSILFIQRQWKR